MIPKTTSASNDYIDSIYTHTYAYIYGCIHNAPMHRYTGHHMCYVSVGTASVALSARILCQGETRICKVYDSLGTQEAVDH